MKGRTNGILVLWLSDVIFSTDYFIKVCCFKVLCKTKEVLHASFIWRSDAKNSCCILILFLFIALFLSYQFMYFKKRCLRYIFRFEYLLHLLSKIGLVKKIVQSRGSQYMCIFGTLSRSGLFMPSLVLAKFIKNSSLQSLNPC